MPSVQNFHAFRFDNFLEETGILIKKSKASLYFHLIFSTESIWYDLKSLMEEYPEDGRRNWKVKLLRTQQEDFYILHFTNKKDDNDNHFFFWKILHEKNKVTILSFSLEKFQYVKSCLDSFVAFSGMKYPWLGSVFLEDLDGFVRSTFGADATIGFDKIIYDLEPIGGKGKPQSNLTFAPLSKDEILKKKNQDYHDSGKFFYIRRMKVRVIWNREEFVFSISDEAEVLFEKGDLIRFLELVDALRSMTILYRTLAERHFSVNIKEIRLEEGKRTEIRSIENLEVLRLNIENPMTESWYDNLTNLFSEPFKSEEKLLSFVVMKGNPYFLVQVIDLEKGGSGIYLSATEKSIKISPLGETTNISTVLKVVRAMQRYVDPNITIAGA